MFETHHRREPERGTLGERYVQTTPRAVRVTTREVTDTMLGCASSASAGHSIRRVGE